MINLAKTERFKKTVEELVDIVGEQNILIDEVSKNLYSYDASMIKALPCGVVNITDVNLIPEVVKILYKNSIPFTPRCAGTNLTGGATNQKGGFIINLAPCTKIHQIDTSKCIAVVEPGVVNMELQKELEKFKYFYPPDPASQKISTIGGNIAENAGGPRCLKYGVTLNNVTAIDVVLPDGCEVHLSIDDFGPEIINLFIGSEGTLGIIKKAYLKIFPLPKFTLAIYSQFNSLKDTMQAVEEIISCGIIPQAMEAIDGDTLRITSKKELPQEIEGALIIEIDDDTEDNILKAKEIITEILQKNNALIIEYADKKEEIDELFRIRKEAYPSLARIANNVLVEDGCVPRSYLVNAVKDIQNIIKKEKIKATLVFHAGDGNIHPNIVFDERDIKETNRIRKIAEKILEVYLKYNGTISAEHGIGTEKRAYVALQHLPQAIRLAEKIKLTIDEKNISNPYKKIPLSSDIPKNINKKKHNIPTKIKNIQDEIIRRYESKKKSIIVGNGSFLKETEKSLILTSKGLTDIIDFDTKNLTITIECGITMNTLNSFLKENNFKTFPEYQGTVGGFISLGIYREIRDFLLSVSFLLSNGDFIIVGSKNMKDTSFYEVGKTLIGSRGTLAFITSITLKLIKGNGEIKMTPKKLTKNITPLHKKIKKVFDPHNLFNPFISKEIYDIQE